LLGEAIRADYVDAHRPSGGDRRHDGLEADDAVAKGFADAVMPKPPKVLNAATRAYRRRRASILPRQGKGPNGCRSSESAIGLNR
jgi:hypothetical protein